MQTSIDTFHAGAKVQACAAAVRFLRRSFRNPLVTLSAASVSVTLLLVGSGIWWLHALAISNAKRELTNLSIVITGLLDTAMRSADVALRDAQTQVRITGLSSPDARFHLHRLFQDIVRNSPQLRTISVIDANGDMQVISREFPAIKHNIADRDYFSILKDRPVSGRFYVGFPVNSETTGERTLSISQAILNEDGAFNGIIRIGMETSYFEDLFSDVNIGKDSAITLIRDDGILLLRSPVDKGRAGRDITKTSAFLLEGNPEPIWHKSPLDGDWRLVSGRKLRDAPMIVAVSLTGETVLSPWRDQAMVVGGVGGVALLILLALCTIAARQLRVREEGMQRAMDQAIAANQAKSHFLANMSHELRTPINAILGFSEMIGMRLFGPDIGASYLERVKLIETSGKHLIRLVNDLLDLEKIDSGHTRLTMDIFDVSELVDGCISMIASEAASKRLSVSRDPSSNTRAFIGDRRVLTQILLNLVGNAVKYCEPGASISIATYIDDNMLQVSVKDDGPGMSSDLLEHIFEPFQTAASQTRRPNSGSGLGLSICKKLAQLHGGAIEIVSAPLKGTTVKFHISSGSGSAIRKSLIAT